LRHRCNLINRSKTFTDVWDLEASDYIFC